jgi:hypothetical protein
VAERIVNAVLIGWVVFCLPFSVALGLSMRADVEAAQAEARYEQHIERLIAYRTGQLDGMARAKRVLFSQSKARAHDRWRVRTKRHK